MTRRDDGRWMQPVTVMEHGRKVRRYFYGKSKADVLRKIREFEHKKSRDVLFENVADRWWEQHEKMLSPTSRDAYERPLDRAKDYFRGRSIEDLHQPDLMRFMRKMIAEHEMSEKSAAMQLTVLKQICRFALINGDVDSSPADGVTIPTGLAKTKRSLPSDRDLAAIKAHPDHPFPFGYWLLYTGLRRGELRALCWEDIDFKRGLITVNKSIYSEHNQPVLKAPKTAAGIRTVPLLKRLSDAIQCVGRGPVFSDGQGHYLTEKRFRTLWDAYCEDLGISCTCHQLRHAFSTLLFESGIDAKDAQHILGHAQISTTMDIYTDIRTQREEYLSKALRNADIRTNAF